MPAAAATTSHYSRGRCGRCGSYELHRSRPRTPFERLLRAVTPITPMRCPACGKRELRTQGQAERIPVPAPPAELGVQSAPNATPRKPSSRRQGRPARDRRRRQWAVVAGSVAMAIFVGYYIGGR